MYKDVKKKILAVVLCICMVIGAVEIVPRVQAAATVNKSNNTIAIKAEKVSSGKSETLTLTVQSLELYYSGESHTPTITSLVDSSGNSVKGTYSLNTTEDCTDVGSHTCYLTIANGEYSVSKGEGTFSFDVVKSTIGSLDITLSSTNVAWQSGGTEPAIGKVWATLQETGARILLNEDQYKPEKQNGTGYKETTVTAKDDSNFTNEKTKSVEYTIAYPLNGTIEAGTTEYEMRIANPTVDYTGNDYVPEIHLYNASNDRVYNATNASTIDINYYKDGSKVDKINDAGTYTIEVKGKNDVVQLNNGCFYMGTFTGTLTVGASGTGGLVVTATDPQNNNQPVTVYKNGDTINRLTYQYTGKPVYLSDFVVYDANKNNKDVTEDFEPSWQNESGAGIARLTLTAKDGSNYSGFIEVTYFITSGLKISGMAFYGYTGNYVNEVYYTGDPITPTTITVTNVAGGELEEGTDYTVAYKYTLDGTEIVTSNKNDANLATAGEKRVVVTGIGAYAKAGSFEEPYRISAVNMESDSYKNDFELSLGGAGVYGDATSGYYVYYKGEAWEPTVTFKYKKNPLTEDVDYTVEWEANVNAGMATVTVRAKDGSNYAGSRSQKFEIKSLDLSTAKVVGTAKDVSDTISFEYTGSGITPIIVLKNNYYEYTLDENDYTVVEYLDKNRQKLDGAPTEIETYYVTIRTANKNITGGNQTLKYNIVAKNIKDIDFDLDGVIKNIDENGVTRTIEWNGGDTQPAVKYTGMIEGTDFTVSYSNNCNVPGTAHVTITGQGNYTGTNTIDYEITKRSLSLTSIIATGRAVYDSTSNAYKGEITVTDEGENVKKKELVEGTDYRVESITYIMEDSNTQYDLNSLPKAGEYKVVLSGQGNYTGITTVMLGCGTDISRATLQIVDDGTLIYDGKEKIPADIIVLTDKEELEYDITGNGAFTLKFSRNNGTVSTKAPIDAGTIYVTAVGNPEKGYFGETTNEVTYEIAPMPLNNKYKAVIVDAEGEGEYDDNGIYTFQYAAEELNPAIKLVDKTNTGPDEIILPQRYYDVSRNGDRVGKGSYTITATGKGNYTGTVTVRFKIVERLMTSNKITVTDDDASSYADGVPNLIITMERTIDEYKLIKGTDYIYDSVLKKDGDKYVYVYTITGKNNFAGTCTYQCDISQTALDGADSMDDWEVGQVFIRQWDMTELLVDPTKELVQKTPQKFTLSYKAAENKYIDLKLGTDFQIEGYGTNTQPGTANSVTIKGINGYSGTETFPVTLYTDISLASFNSSSTIQSGGAIALTVLNDALNSENPSDALAKLVSLAPLWSDETGGRIDPANYEVTVDDGYTPQIGEITFIIAGKQTDPKYYAGSREVTMTVTGALDSGQIRVEIGDNNVVPWNGKTVMPDDVKVQVYDGNKLLTGGYIQQGETVPDTWDYTVTFSDNTTIGLATAIINGANKYSESLTQTFKITYPMSDLIVQIQDDGGKWNTYDGGSPSYLYKVDTTRNKPALKLYYNQSGTLCEVGTELYSVTYNGYENAGNANAVIGAPENEKYQGILLGNSRAVSYVLEQIQMKDVIVASSCEWKTSFTGFALTAKDIGLSLTYGTYSLTDADYRIDYYNNINADNVDNAPGRVVITGKGNFDGVVEKEFNILPMPIGSTTDINATAEDLIYTGTAVAPKLTVNQVTGKLYTLKDGVDYKIVGYLDTTKSKLSTTPYTQVGSYYVRIEGVGNYYEQMSPYRDIPYQIIERQMTDGVQAVFVNTDSCPVTGGIPDCVYNGNEHEPAVQVIYNGIILKGPGEANPDYDLLYENNTNAGTASVTVIGTGSFSDSKKLEFTIRSKDIAGEDMTYLDVNGNIFADEQEFEWQKDTPVRPAVSVYDNSRSEDLVQGEGAGDYTVTYTDNNEDQNTQVNAGKVTMTITGTGNYGGTKEFTYYIGEDISKAYALVNGKSSVSVDYNGLVQAPEESSITVVAGGTVLEDANGEKRYDIAYYKNGFSDDDVVTRDQMVDAGTYYVAIVGVPTKGTYAKSSVSNSCVYTINPRSIAPSYILVSGFDSSYYYTGQAIEPKGIVVEDSDLPVISDVNDPQRRTLTLINGVDYDISYRNNVSAGEAVIVVNGKGNYTGSREAYFTIISSDATGNNTWNGNSEGTGSISIGTTTISVSDIKLGFDNSTYNCMRYTGYPVQPQVTINGMSTNDFIITAQNNINPGMATLYIQGAGNNYTGQIIMYYAIKADLGTYGRVVDIADQVYTGYQITPNVTITCGGNLLNQGSDFTVTYANNINVGRATVVAYAASDSYYTGSISSGFNISNAAGGMQVTGYASSYTYSGYPITPDVVVTMNGRVLNRGTDYTVSYSNNINVGTATMIVTGLGSFSGSQTINFTIEAKNIENCMTTAVTNYQYTGSTYTPNVTITDSSTGKTLVAGTDYTITYSNNTNPGTASITVTALSKNYTGTKVIPFKITSAAVSGLRTSTIKNNSIKLAWSAQDYADGYQICNSKNQVVATTRKNSYTVKGLTSCTTYKFKVRSYVENADGTVSYGNFSTAVSAKTLLNTPTLKVKSTSKGKVTLTWTKVAKATGYEIYYSTKKNGVYTRLKTISKSSKRRYVDAGLASGEKYYYTIRAYRTANGVKTYSSYNTIKSVKVK